MYFPPFVIIIYKQYTEYQNSGKLPNLDRIVTVNNHKYYFIIHTQYFHNTITPIITKMVEKVQTILLFIEEKHIIICIIIFQNVVALLRNFSFMASYELYCSSYECFEKYNDN